LDKFRKWQETEQNAVIARTRTAKQWNDFGASGELFPNIKWIPSRSVSLREEHIPFYNRVWAKNDPFWSTNQPGTLWGCKCDWEETDEPVDGIQTDVVPAKGLKGNPGETGEIFSADASYFTENALKNITDIHYRDALSELKINVCADKREIADNIRTGRILAQNKDVNTISIRQHSYERNVKNPEYEINGMIADAKRLQQWDMATGFNKAIKQGSKAVVIDFFKIQHKTLDTHKIAASIVNRHLDFTSKTVEECYIVWGEKSMKVSGDFFPKFNLRKRNSYILELMEKIEIALK
jgi:hypothetical protein